MKTKLLTIIIFSSLLSSGAYGQQNMLYNHYYLNPFLYNPSYIAPSGYTELYLNYRRQWSGISGAPTTGTLNLHLPLSYKAGVAFTAYQDVAGLLNTTTGLISFSYQVYLGQRITDVHKLSFGLSAGVTNSRIKADEADDIQDPVLGTNTSSMDGQVGIHYRYNNFRLGFAIPRIFETKVASEQSFNRGGLAQLDNTISTISYDFRISERFSLEPMVTYRTYQTLPSYYEALATFKMANTGWIGGAYRQGYGAFAFFGVNIKEKLKVAYAYEFATDQTDRIGNGSHEVQMALRLGKKQFSKPQSVRKAAPVESHTETVTNQKLQADEEPSVELSHSIDPVSSDAETVVRDQIDDDNSSNSSVVLSDKFVKGVTQPDQGITGVVEKSPTQDGAPSGPVHTLEGDGLGRGHYVVVGAFHSLKNAKSYASTLKKSGYPAEVAYDPLKEYYIVHMNNPSQTLEDAREMRDKYRQMSRFSFRDTWILIIE